MLDVEQRPGWGELVSTRQPGRFNQIHGLFLGLEPFKSPFTSLVQIRGLKCICKDVRTITANTDMKIACSAAWQ